MKKNILNLYEGFFDDLDKLNQDKVNDEFGKVNSGIYDEHDIILSQDKNPEFFEGLCNMCKEYYKEYYPNLPSNKNGFKQEDLDKITYLNINPYIYESYFRNVTSLDELQYFYNLEKIYSWSFYNCRDLKSIIFPENLKVIQDNAFGGCNSLKELKFPENIQFISDHAFIYCDSLEKIIIPKIFKKNIKNIFAYVDLTNVNITYI